MGNVTKMGNTADVVGRVAEQSDYLLFQGLQKNPAGDLHIFGDADVITTLAKHNYHDIILEINEAEQAAIDNYLAGRITRDEILRWFAVGSGLVRPEEKLHYAESLLRVIDNSAAQGVRVHAMGQYIPEVALKDIAQAVLYADESATVKDLRKLVERELENAIISSETGNLYRDTKTELEQWNKIMAKLDEKGRDEAQPLVEMVASCADIDDLVAGADMELYRNIICRTAGRKAAVMCSATKDLEKARADMILRYLADYLQKSGRLDLFLICNDETVLEKIGVRNIKALTARGIFVIQAATKQHEQVLPLGKGILASQLPKISVLLCQEVDVSKLGEMSLQRDLKNMRPELGPGFDKGFESGRSK